MPSAAIPAQTVAAGWPVRLNGDKCSRPTKRDCDLFQRGAPPAEAQQISAENPGVDSELSLIALAILLLLAFLGLPLGFAMILVGGRANCVTLGIGALRPRRKS